MPKFFVPESQIEEENKKIYITGTDVNHIKNVLRTKIGEKIIVGRTPIQQDYLCTIQKIQKEEILCQIIEKLETRSERRIEVTVFQGLPKSDKMEMIIQKSVELGVNDIVPVEMRRCVVKLNEKDKKKKQERWQKISEVAAKQCGRDIIPEIKDCVTIKNICDLCKNYDLVLVAYENEKENKIKTELQKVKSKSLIDIVKIAIVIGPEGGLEPVDVELLKENGAKIVTLGNRILRTETVALNVLSNIMYELED